MVRGIAAPRAEVLIADSLELATGLVRSRRYELRAILIRPEMASARWADQGGEF